MDLREEIMAMAHDEYLTEDEIASALCQDTTYVRDVMYNSTT